MKLGILLLEENTARFRSLAEQADEVGVDSAWTIEYYNRNSLVRLAVMASVTQRMTIGTAVTAAFARAPLMLATASAEIVALAPGRAVLGLGSSTRRMNEEWYGIAADHPAPRMEELVCLLRELAEHESGPFEHIGRFYQLRFAHLDKIVYRPMIPIYTAGVNARMVEVAGRVGNGFVGHPIATVAYLQSVALPAVAAGAEKTGRELADVQRSTQVITAVDDDLAAARRRAALQVAFYSTVKTYDVIFALHGFQEEREAIRTAFLANDVEEMLRAVSPAMLEQMAVYGSQHSVLDQLQRYREVADDVILYPPHFGVSADDLLREQERIIEMIDVAKQSSLANPS